MFVNKFQAKSNPKSFYACNIAKSLFIFYFFVRVKIKVFL